MRVDQQRGGGGGQCALGVLIGRPVAGTVGRTSSIEKRNHHVLALVRVCATGAGRIAREGAGGLVSVVQHYRHGVVVYDRDN